MKNTNKLLIILLILCLLASASACSLFGYDTHVNPTVVETSESDVVYTEQASFTELQTEPATELNDDFDISSLTLEQKVAQMILVSCHDGVDIGDAISSGVGGLCLYAQSFENKNKYDVIDMTRYYQSLAQIPLLISTDEEGGEVNRVSINENLRAVPFWSPSDLYAEGGWELIKSDTVEKAELLLSLGVNVNLAPVCDVPLSEDNYIYSRCFSTNANDTGDYVALVVSVMKEAGIGTTLKHFPGYGGSIDTHENVSYDDRDYSSFENGDFIPFQRGIAEGADCVLVSHNIVTSMDADMPASLSKPVHDILRNELGFEGVIMTDDLIMEGITQFTDGKSAAVFAVLAGNDMLCCRDYDEAITSILNAVEDGVISEEQINSSVMRIVKWKTDLNLL